MRILQIHNYYQNYGGECHVVDVERKLLEVNGHEVIQYVRHSSDINSWSAAKKTFSLVSIPYNLLEHKALLKFIKQVKPDVAHVHNVFPLISPSAYFALAKAGIPTVQTVHNYRFLCPNGMFFIQKRVCEECQTRNYLSAIKKRCMHNSYAVSALYATAIANLWRSNCVPDNISRFIALNQFVFDKLKTAGIPREKIAICGNFIDSEHKTLPAKKRYILYLGRLSSEKGVMTLLKAVASLDNVILKVAGNGPEEMALKKYALKYANSRIEFPGFVEGEEKKCLVSQAICLVIPSEWYENFPISVLESLSSGTPVIASRIGGLTDMVSHNSTGFLFKPGDVNELAGYIKMLWGNYSMVEEMSKQAINIANTKFNADNHLKNLINIYNEVVS